VAKEQCEIKIGRKQRKARKMKSKINNGKLKAFKNLNIKGRKKC
jgi:hypothetical protein